MDERLRTLELFAWLGEDELGSKRIGIKQGVVPAGVIPIVVMGEDRVKAERLYEQMNMQAKHYGKKIRLCRFVFAGVALTTESGA